MILIDDRDGSRPLADLLPLDGHCELTRLDFELDGKEVPCGDAMLTGHGPQGSTIRVGVEVKSVYDLLSSISTGRLGGTQIPRMLRVFDAVWVLYYGPIKIGHDNTLQIRRGTNWKVFKLGRRPVPYSYLSGALISYQMLATINTGKPLFVQHAYDVGEAACWLRVMDHWLEKRWESHKALNVFDRSRVASSMPGIDPVEEQIARTAASLPAVDWVRGHRLAKAFDSIEDLMGASKSELMQVSGIGPVIASSVVQAIRRRKGQ